LGAFAAASFAALVATSFASGYHLVGRGEPVSKAPSALAPALSEQAVRQGESAAGRPAVVRKHDNHDSAMVRDAPRSGEPVDQLSPDTTVAVIGQEGDWYRIRYQGDGQPREGWTHEVNLALQ
jgi:hypothetical protein